jgi:hypothetical protein
MPLSWDCFFVNAAIHPTIIMTKKMVVALIANARIIAKNLEEGDSSKPRKPSPQKSSKNL